MFKTSKIRIACLILLLSVHTAAHCISKNPGYKIKTIVLDAGHGGHDTGCNGPSHSYEKDVTLKIILGLGKLIEENYPDIKVLYSRTTDVFITLQDRALLANKNNADLFLSVHCNANPNKSAYGTETYLMGLHVSQANLEVARRENSVIKLEKNYQTTYEGFDPDSPEAMIALSLNQNANIEQSTFLASKVQESLTTKLNRFNRGVKQAGFWVLYRTTCPSILIETGFLTNRTEEKYLTSRSGEEELSNAIFKAFEEYKNTIEKGSKLTPPVIVNTNDNYIKDDDDSSSDIPTVESPEKTNAPVFPKNPSKEKKEPVTKKETSKKIVYKVQIKASNKPLAKSDKAYKIIGDLKYEKVKGAYKYLAGPYESYDMAQKMVKKAKRSGYKDAFVVVYKNGERLSFNEAKQYFK
ncbi:MAG: N-acetylmuramoyl-L-alanine amidase AmiA precursor [Bacteroidota bacterium]|nr:N-acetylmuramoyl-L-alanine amidase AmiA precursor [Bacteroidota bacterium]